jgi:hypothetical protein
MPVTTTHQYLANYPIKPTDKRLIVGTIHPHLHDDFLIPFFYGNVGSLWNILSEAFPHLGFENYQTIQRILSHYNIGITDIIRQCDREHENVTQDQLLYNLHFNTEQISDAINESEIDIIYFTSRFGKNNAAKLFTSEFGINYRGAFDDTLSEFILPERHFGREIRCVVLYSPSGQANIGISKALPFLNNIDYYKQFNKPVNQFKIDFYREKFNFLN